jgi:hypothetical protein
MKQDFDHKLISTIDRLVGQVHPLASFIDSIVDRIVPKTTAQASCGPCSNGYYEYCVKGGCPGEKYRDHIYHGVNNCGSCTVYGSCTYC